MQQSGSNKHLAPRSSFLIPFSNKRNQGSSWKGLILGPVQAMCKRSLEHLMVPESKEVLRKKPQMDRGANQRKLQGQNWKNLRYKLKTD